MVVPTIGITFGIIDEPRSIISAPMSVVGLIGTAPGADPAKYPLNTNVLINTADSAMKTSLGLTGTLPDAIAAIHNQLGEGQTAAQVVVVRVTEGVDADATMTNIVGSSTLNTGVWALVNAGAELGVMPRIIGVPGYTTQSKNGVSRANINLTNPGAGGANGTFALAFTGGTGTGAAGTFTVVAGSITTIDITNGGVYTVAPTISFAASAGLTGAAATVTLDVLANPVVATLPALLDRLEAVAFVDAPATSYQAFVDWRENVSSKRIVAIAPAVKVGVSGTVKSPSAYAIGEQVQVDYENDGVPSRSICNRDVAGIVGISRPIPFSITDGASEGQTLLAQNAMLILRGEAGVEFAVAAAGFKFFGTDNIGTDETWRQYHSVRMRSYIHLTALKTLRDFLGKPLQGQTVQAVHNILSAFMRSLKANGHIIDFKAEFPASANPVADLRAGKIEFLLRAEETPLVKRIHIRSSKYSLAFNELVSNLATQLNSSVAA